MKTSTKVSALNVSAIALTGVSIGLIVKKSPTAAAAVLLGAKVLAMKAQWTKDEAIIARATAGAVAVRNMDINSIIANAVANVNKEV